MEKIKKLLNSKIFFVSCLFFIVYFDYLLTIFAISGGFGRPYRESNPTLKNIINTGNITMLFLIAVATSVFIGLQIRLWDEHWIWRAVFWILLLYRFLSYAINYIV